jgi:spermidine synthase
MVHQIAKFLPLNSIKRVLFVGGGDSMLLHEALKYPSVELVVGLELDQKVTRGCFKHFGTQPHFDDDRVEWWFGDASKSLLMLPKDYFASFDLVLVDLSETVMSFSVTNELTVIEALTLLVKPDGIFVKNEVYFNDLMKIFPYTAQLRWYVMNECSSRVESVICHRSMKHDCD